MGHAHGRCACGCAQRRPRSRAPAAVVAAAPARPRTGANARLARAAGRWLRERLAGRLAGRAPPRPSGTTRTYVLLRRADGTDIQPPEITTSWPTAATIIGVKPGDPLGKAVFLGWHDEQTLTLLLNTALGNAPRSAPLRR